jgi:two-component system, NtrC family, nitrogen regulation sensor histidine kinase NtrY
MAISTSLLPRSALARLASWRRSANLSGRLALLLAVAATVSGIATYVVISGSPPYGPSVRTVLVLLYLDLVLLLLLGAVVARRLVQLIAARRQGSAGSRLHVRLAGLFSVVAVLPAIVVATFSILFLNVGLEAWFSERVRSTLDNSLSVAKAYLEEHKDVIRADALAMAADVNREGAALIRDGYPLQRLIEAQAALRSLTEAIVFTSSGQVVARTGLSFTLEVESIPPGALTQAGLGEVVTLTSDTDDRVRALVRLDAFVDAYLYVGRFVDPRVIGYMERTQRMVDEYHQLETGRSGIQITFAAMFTLVALLLLLAAVWVGLAFANRLAMPISRLIAAADRVRAGDLSARVPQGPEGDEVATLSRAFNRMTSQLASQREELILANHQLDQRRRFTEAVLTGVTAGVIGVDPQGRITLTNASAAAFLGGPAEDLMGRPVVAVLPGLAAPLARLALAPERPLQQQLEVVRGARNHSLLVRIAAQLGPEGEAGCVVTFDDITDLLAAQRQAAWAEIARRIAHEVKNPLTPIQLSAERLRRKYLKEVTSDPDAFAGCTDTIVRQVDTIRRLIDEFSAFARMPAPVFRRERVGEVVRQAVLMQELAWPSLRFETMLPAEEVHLYCDVHKVTQALTNLLQNAVDSLQETVPPPEAGGLVQARLYRDEGRIVIEVEDNGKGLPGDRLDRLTEPYVTTRAKGTGLGLAIVKKIMEEHEGELAFGQREGGGARVRLLFPAARGVEAAAE